MRDDELVARRSNVHLCVMENQVLKMDELTGDPHTGDGIEKVRAFSKACADLGSGNPLIKPGKRVLCCRFHFPISIAK